MVVKNRILFITSSNSQGGAEKQLFRLIESISVYNITLICLSDNKQYDIYHKLNGINGFKYILLNPKKLISIKYLLKESLDLIHKNKTKTLIIGWLAKGNLIALLICILKPFKTITFCCHRSLFSLNQSKLSQIMLWTSLLAYLIYPKKIIHIINSNLIASSKLTRIFLKSKPLLIPNSYFKEKNIIRSKIIQSNDSKNLNLLVVARFSPEKGYKLLFESLRDISIPYKLKCIGKGCSFENHSFKRLCNKYKINPIVEESVGNIYQEYKNTDFLILSSYSEAFPNVIIESIMEGTPAICTPVGPLTNLLKTYGLVSNSFSPEDLRRSIMRADFIKKNSDLYKEISSSLSKRIKDYILTPEEAGIAYEQIFKYHLEK